jgi:hypothetical protein
MGAGALWWALWVATKPITLPVEPASLAVLAQSHCNVDDTHGFRCGEPGPQPSWQVTVNDEGLQKSASGVIGGGCLVSLALRLDKVTSIEADAAMLSSDGVPMAGKLVVTQTNARSPVVLTLPGSGHCSGTLKLEIPRAVATPKPTSSTTVSTPASADVLVGSDVPAATQVAPTSPPTPPAATPPETTPTPVEPPFIIDVSPRTTIPSERELLLALMPAPLPPPPPDVSTTPFGLIAGGATAGVVGLSFGVVQAGVLMPASSPLLSRLIAGLSGGVCAGLACALPAVGGGFLFDLIAGPSQEETNAVTEFERQRVAREKLGEAQRVLAIARLDRTPSEQAVVAVFETTSRNEDDESPNETPAPKPAQPPAAKTDLKPPARTLDDDDDDDEE